MDRKLGVKKEEGQLLDIMIIMCLLNEEGSSEAQSWFETNLSVRED